MKRSGGVSRMSVEERAAVARLYLSGGDSGQEVADAAGITLRTLRRWVAEYRAAGGSGSAAPVPADGDRVLEMLRNAGVEPGRRNPNARTRRRRHRRKEQERLSRRILEGAGRARLP